VAASFLRPGGILYVTEIHPVAQVFADEDVAPGELRVQYPYFPRSEPLAFPVVGSYADESADVAAPVEYAWVHSLGEIVTAVANAGLRIELLHEWPFVEWKLPFLEQAPDIHSQWRLPASVEGELPLFFSLRARA
jgi:hypothetical protein